MNLYEYLALCKSGFRDFVQRQWITLKCQFCCAAFEATYILIGRARFYRTIDATEGIGPSGPSALSPDKRRGKGESRGAGETGLVRLAEMCVRA